MLSYRVGGHDHVVEICFGTCTAPDRKTLYHPVGAVDVINSTESTVCTYLGKLGKYYASRRQAVPRTQHRPTSLPPQLFSSIQDLREAFSLALPSMDATPFHGTHISQCTHSIMEVARTQCRCHTTDLMPDGILSAFPCLLGIFAHGRRKVDANAGPVDPVLMGSKDTKEHHRRWLSIGSQTLLAPSRRTG